MHVHTLPARKAPTELRVQLSGTTSITRTALRNALQQGTAQETAVRYTRLHGAPSAGQLAPRVLPHLRKPEAVARTLDKFVSGTAQAGQALKACWAAGRGLDGEPGASRLPVGSNDGRSSMNWDRRIPRCYRPPQEQVEARAFVPYQAIQSARKRA